METPHPVHCLDPLHSRQMVVCQLIGAASLFLKALLYLFKRGQDRIARTVEVACGRTNISHISGPSLLCALPAPHIRHATPVIEKLLTPLSGSKRSTKEFFCLLLTNPEACGSAATALYLDP